MTSQNKPKEPGLQGRTKKLAAELAEEALEKDQEGMHEDEMKEEEEEEEEEEKKPRSGRSRDHLLVAR